MSNPYPLENMETTQRLYCFIRAYIAENGIAPTQRRMGEACFISPGSVTRHLDRLHMWGYINRIPGAMRGITLADDPPFECRDYAFEPHFFRP